MGKTCPAPGCRFHNCTLTEEDVVLERERRRNGKRSSEWGSWSDELHAHLNYVFEPATDVEFDRALPGVIHLCHNSFDRFLSAVWHDIDVLYPKDHNLVKHDFVTAMCNMGVGCMPPKHVRGIKNDVEKPALKGTDLSVLRTELGIFTLLQVVYNVADAMDANASGPASAPNTVFVEEGEELALRWRQERGSRESARRVADAQRYDCLHKACRALEQLWVALAPLKSTETCATAASRGCASTIPPRQTRRRRGG